MRSPLQNCVEELRVCAGIVGEYSGKELADVTRRLERVAEMLAPLGLGEFAVVNLDGSITPTGRERMPGLKSNAPR